VQLAEVLGITQVAVSDRVRGKTPLSLADIDLLARHFGVSPAVFVDPVHQSGHGLLTCTKYQAPQVRTRCRAHYGIAANNNLNVVLADA
jgi:transcriptional regulator with XRE-family HTH domain